MGQDVVEVMGVPLAVTDVGAGPAVLFVHGMGLDQRMWALQLGAVAASGRRAVAYDLRGHGRSGVPATGYRVTDFTDEAMGVLDALGIERAHVVGLSLGGSIVARMAVRHPERIVSVTVIGSMASGYPTLSEFIRQGGTAALVMDGRMDLETFRRERLSSFLYAPTLADPVVGSHAREILADALRTTAVLIETTRERIEGWPAPTDWDIWTDPDRRVPALVMAGSMDDPTFQGFARDSTGLPRTRTAIVEGYAHLANISHAHVVDPLLLEHLDDAERAPG
jgi:pimeloyl-ACP methyl ester carboxylesterase